MYFSYFRGRQYELLALRELVEKGLLSSHVIPVIEPIKISTTFINTMQAYSSAQLKLGLVFNPVVGDLVHDENITRKLSSFLDGKNVIPSVIINDNILDILSELEGIGIHRSNTLAILENRDFLGDYGNGFCSVPPQYTLLPDDRKIKHAVEHNKVLFRDRFVKQPRNADYPADEFFSEDHLYYTEEGYIGFADYSIVGNEYVESSFAPYAVAIHIVYMESDESFRIRHFISDSNDDTTDVAGKFFEAVSKLAEWYKGINPHQLTTGLETLLRHYKNRTYPGLPTLKKLAIMHHLELVGKFFDGEINA